LRRTWSLKIGEAIECNLALIKEAAKTDWKAAPSLLERRHPEKFSRPEVQLSQQTNVLNGHSGNCSLSPEKLEEERKLLDSIQRISVNGCHPFGCQKFAKIICPGIRSSG
jgi:hypothetical protein